MNEKPILMKPGLVKATLDGIKTETRRVINPQPGKLFKPHTHHSKQAFVWKRGIYAPEDFLKVCKFGGPGDQLWVRETWQVHSVDNIKNTMEIRYKADDCKVVRGGEADKRFGVREKQVGIWKPSIHMPRAFSRLDLLIKEVLVERVQDITTEGILAEGIQVEYKNKDRFPIVYESLLLERFSKTWDDINKKRGWGWDINPWVFVIKYEVVK